MTPIQIKDVIARLRVHNPNVTLIADISKNIVRVAVSRINCPTRNPEWSIESTTIESFEASLLNLLRLYED